MGKTILGTLLLAYIQCLLWHLYNAKQTIDYLHLIRNHSVEELKIIVNNKNKLKLCAILYTTEFIFQFLTLLWSIINLLIHRNLESLSYFVLMIFTIVADYHYRTHPYFNTKDEIKLFVVLQIFTVSVVLTLLTFAVFKISL